MKQGGNGVIEKKHILIPVDADFLSSCSGYVKLLPNFRV